MPVGVEVVAWGQCLTDLHLCGLDPKAVNTVSKS